MSSPSTTKEAAVAAVVLTHNSEDDLPACLDGLLAQEGVDLRIIVVDNASATESRARTIACFLDRCPDGLVLDAAAGRAAVAAWPSRAVLLANDVNGGYSAGNNIGARAAVALGCEAVLIVNPDMRLADPRYVATLAAALRADPAHALAASALRNLQGDNENPMHEPGFLEELLWPLRMVLSAVGLGPRARPRSDGPVLKVSGACFLASARFLEEIGFFDEGVFLYCEEAILSVQVRQRGRRIAYVPGIEALHAHQSSAKGDPVRRFEAWVRSRRYWHRRYAGYGPLRRGLLGLSLRGVVGLARLRRAASQRLGRA